MALTSSEWVAHLSVLVIVVSMAMIGVELTGRVTDTGTVNITIVSSAAINFTVSNIDWSEGQVDQGQTLATLNTEGTVTNGNWTTVVNGFRLENIGNVNVSLNFSADKDADAFIGGTTPTFQYKITNNETNACLNNSVATYTEITGSGVVQAGCLIFQYLDSNDTIEVDIEINVPYDASGTKGTFFTANATAI